MWVLRPSTKRAACDDSVTCPGALGNQIESMLVLPSAQARYCRIMRLIGIQSVLGVWSNSGTMDKQASMENHDCTQLSRVLFNMLMMLETKEKHFPFPLSWMCQWWGL